MGEERTFSLSEIARMLEAPQHRLIHLCEKGVVVPEIHDAAGRGSSRVFSANNFLELAVALRLRDMMLPVSVVGAIVHVLRAFGQQLQAGRKGISLVESLRGKAWLELRVIVSDGQQLFFTLARPDRKPTLFGGIALASLVNGGSGQDAAVQESGTHLAYGNHPFGGPEGSKFGRLELSVTAVARSLPLD